MLDLMAGEVEWLTTAGRNRVHLGPEARYARRTCVVDPRRLASA
jgi:hypothetical protein